MIKKIKHYIKILISNNNNIDEKSLCGLLLVITCIIIIFIQVIISIYYKKYIDLLPEWMYISTLLGGLACFGVSGFFNNKNKSE